MKKIITLLLSFIFLLTGCAFPGLGGNAQTDGIVVTSGSLTERQVLSEITVQMINHYLPDVKTDLINNISSTLLIVQTVRNGNANVIGANYSGTSLTGELGEEAIIDPKEAFEKVVKGYDEQLDMIWFPSYGFDNTYAFMVTEEFAKKHNLKNTSDLEELKDTIKVGADAGWIDKEGDGYKAFKEKYGFGFKNLMPMEMGIIYDAVKDGKMDVVLGYSTDGRIQSNNLVLLEDDKQIFPAYDASPVTSKEILKRYPKLEEILLKLEGEVDNEMMQKLNRKSDQDKIEPRLVAEEFLKANNYFENKKVKKLEDRELYKEILKGN
ncbi:osmoprotectant ABC transporter substrate-binding protein [Helcococcus kunzii]|uniref:osmoprotectant ABC transporter substrate-binding protein n=1 Tax=Helcococcus kunzii TaxID=40091 RepID=UPI001BAF62B6|nr:osmoprotectant ABC transporter substrate-binding protein [Helcococcus kunzii]QUY65036.1 osmoprotectant ABC transporter substrate-binding protein [Helcococcus kunzii]